MEIRQKEMLENNCEWSDEDQQAEIEFHEAGAV
jgi:hypothetical protein